MKLSQEVGSIGFQTIVHNCYEKWKWNFGHCHHVVLKITTYVLANII